MKIQKKLLILIIFCVLLFIIGCRKVNRYAHFSKLDQTLSWSAERNRSFGDTDYSAVRNEEEAFKILQEKYRVHVPNYYNETKKLFKTELTSQFTKMGDVQYGIYARNKELEFRTIYPFYHGEELQVFSEVILTYSYSIDHKLAYLKSQIVTVKISPINGNLPNNNLKKLIEEIGSNMKISKKQIISGITGYEKRVKAAETPITEDYLKIISNSNSLERTQELLKEIALVYDESGAFRELYAEVSDQMDY